MGPKEADDRDVARWLRRIIAMPWHERLDFLKSAEFCAKVPLGALRRRIRGRVLKNSIERERDRSIREPRLDFVGQTINRRYLIIRFLGAGGFGFVFEAEDAQRASQTVALKMIRSGRSDGGARSEIAVHSLFGPTRIEHPQLPNLIGSGGWRSPWGEDYDWITLSMIDGGRSVDRYCFEECLSLRRRCELIARAAEGLAKLHDHDILHGDVSTTNIIVARGKPYWLDFGLSARCSDFAGGNPHFFRAKDGRVILRMDVLAITRVLLAILREIDPVERGSLLYDPRTAPWRLFIRTLEDWTVIDSVAAPRDGREFCEFLNREIRKLPATTREKDS